MKFGKILVSLLILIGAVNAIALAQDRVSLGFIYGASNSIDLVKRTNGAMNQVAPTCFNLNDRGNLVITAELSHHFVDTMHEDGILVTPFLSNHWSRTQGRAALKNADKLTDQIVSAVEEYNLDGINVDLENLTPEDKEALNSFVRLLREKLPEGKLLTVCVASNPTGKDTGWQGSYDYDVLGEIADYLFVMAYDEHSQGGPIGPVSSNEFVESSIQYALEHVSKDKIVIGIALYGRYWKLIDAEKEEYKGGEAVVIGAMPNLISKTKGVVDYDPEIGEAQVTFTIDDDTLSTSINGRELDNGTYVVWYSTNDSIKAKLALVNKYDLLGSGVWALGQEKVEVWEYYKDALNEIPREDPVIVVVEAKPEAHKIDLTPIIKQWLKDRSTLRDLRDKEIKMVEALEAEDVEIEMPHKHEKVFDSVKYVKTKEEIGKNTKVKSSESSLSLKLAISNNNHIYRMEANY